MNKLIIVIIVIIVLVGGFFYWQSSSQKAVDLNTTENDSSEVVTGEVKKFTVRAVKNEWKFDPGVINVSKGDIVEITLVNEDEYDHGFGVDELNINERMPANSTVTISFVAGETGEFDFYCSVPCGSGTVGDVKRSHLDMVGKIIVT